MAHHIIDFRLEVDLKTFLDTFWYSNEFYSKYLNEHLLDKDVTIGEWSLSASEEEANSKVRHVQSQHPCKVSFPGLPSHADSTKIQKLNFERESEGELTILESNTFKGIPMADYFRVDTLWCVKQAPDETVDVIVTAEVVFLYSTWLRGSIESNTYAELHDVFASWKDVATSHVLTLPSPVVTTSATDEEEQKAVAAHPVAAIVSLPPLFPTPSSGSISACSSSVGSGSGDDLDDFYDCEEGLGVEGGGSDTPLLQFRDMMYRRRMGTHLLTPQELIDMYDQAEKGDANRDDDGGEGGDESTGLLVRSSSAESDGSEGGREQPMRRYVAITVVEIVFVLAESTFWQARRMYKHDLKELFRVEPTEVLRRVGCSLLPGLHTPLLASPDLFGPVAAACLLPQVMLAAMDSAHHGCSRSSLLGDAVVVSLCLWAGLASFYRVFGVLVAPLLHFKHCLCLTGYSLFPWVLALFLSHLFDSYPSPHLSAQLPLYVLGLPTAIAQGYVFWEYTPLSFHHHHDHLHRLLPPSLLALSQRHRRVTDSVLWYIPKALVLLIIAVTHYQFLWYVAHSFLPGRKHQCHLSALLNPANYADILSQKDLRSFALDVAKKVG